MITLRFSGRVPSPRAVIIGQETDSRADTLRFILPEIADGQEATLQMILPDGTPDTVLIQDGMITIPARMTEIAGRTRAWVEILAGEVLAWHSEIIYLEVGELPPISERTEQEYPTAFQQVIAQSLANKNAAQAAQTAAEAAQTAAENAAAGAAQDVRDALEDLAGAAAASATQAAGSATQAAGSAEQAAGSASSAAGSAAAAAGSAGSAEDYASAAAGSANDAASSAEAAAQSAREAESAAHITIDQIPRAGSTNPVASGGVYNALATKQDALTFDDAPTEGSDNPVKSGGIKEALDGKKNTQTAISSPSASGNALSFIDTISQNEQGVITATKKSVTVDATPTENSTNPVQSGGVKAALDGKQNTLTLPLPVSQGGTGSNSLWRFLGHNTNFVYTSANGTPNANDITYEDHLFAVNMPNTPGHGFLDVSYNDGAGFVPSNEKPIIRQIWTNYSYPSDVRVRIKMGDSAWTRWVRFGTIPITANLGTITGTGSTVTVTKAVTGVTSIMTVDRIEFETPSAVQSGWTVTTAANSVTFSATISGSTTVKIKLSDNMDVTGT